MDKKITLVGCGNIGSRHLQALVNLPYQIDLEIIDPDENSQKLAKTRLDELKYVKSNFNFTWGSSIENITKSDLVIIATPSINRVKLVEDLLKIGNKKFLLEKMVCQSDKEFDYLLSISNLHEAKIWVNTPRRYYDSYQKIKNQIINSKINITVNTGNMGLGSNAIHFIDLFLWLTENDQITLNGNFLDKELLENKRSIELTEFSGTIMGTADNGSILSINFLHYDNLPLTVNFSGKNNSFLIDETNQKIYNLIDKTLSEFKIEFQSTLTTKIVKDIFENKTVHLPTLQESKISHSELFRIFNKHIKKITGLEVEKCPIT